MRARWDRRHDRRRLVAALPVAVELMAAAIRGGGSLVDALDMAGRGVGGVCGSDLARVRTRLERGATTVEALHHWRDERPVDGVARLVLTCEVGLLMGGGLEMGLDALAAGLRLDEAAAASRRIAATQSVTSGAVMTALPVLAIVSQADSLIGTSWGVGCLAAALGLDVLGAWWMWRLVGGAR